MRFIKSRSDSLTEMKAVRAVSKGQLWAIGIGKGTETTNLVFRKGTQLK